MKNRLYQSLFLGITSAIAASASYALITPQNEKQAKTENLATTIAAIPSIYDTTSDFIEQAIRLEQLANLEAPIKPRTIHHEIQEDESLASILSLYGVDKKTLRKITEANKIGARFTHLNPQTILTIELDKNYQLKSLIYDADNVNTLVASRNEEQFDVHVESRSLDAQEILTQGTIETNLAVDGKKAGLSVEIIDQLTDKIFAWDIDFSQDLNAGDKFTVIYEETLVEGRRLKTGNILAAEFIIGGKSYSAIRYQNSQGEVTYYSPQGKNVVRETRKSFLRSPIAYARVSSHFNLHRRHPISHRIRAHKGVDYAARNGTPIQATGGGKIIFKGRQSGYGRVVIIEHDSQYKSLYAHLSRFNNRYKVGSLIKQGETLGFVGQSGAATGPHLHYEFLVNGAHKNPVTVKLPQTEIQENKGLLARFQQKSRPYIERLNRANSETAIINVDKFFAKKSDKL
ncbi:MAG: peptidoglycan DD-metalloendopeptidase family protein [Methylococcales bacterium]|nr:peptidoglycan DD-metalloendopeptidase family protein [Methylococcales bacterium]